ncbi:MAG: hypothetical protein KGJ21_07305 [Pseudomonadota bacterium]|nr:hypothetical protein [Pseudomonadota bacterium]
MNQEAQDAAPSDERIAKTERGVKRAWKTQPVKAAAGALAGGIAAEAIAAGGFMCTFFGEMSVHANKTGISILEVSQNKEILSQLGSIAFTDLKSAKKLKPYMLAVVAAPFAGSAIGAWVTTVRGMQSFKKKQSALDTVQKNASAKERGG